MPYLSTFEVYSRRGAIQIHVYLYLYLQFMAHSVPPASSLQIVRMPWKGTRPRTGARPILNVPIPHLSPLPVNPQHGGIFIRPKFITFLYFSLLILCLLSCFLVTDVRACSRNTVIIDYASLHYVCAWQMKSISQLNSNENIRESRRGDKNRASIFVAGFTHRRNQGWKREKRSAAMNFRHIPSFSMLK